MSYRRDIETELTQQNANLSVKQTLAQQIQITERDIAIRKKMLGFTKTHEKSLTKAKEIAYQNVNQIVENFYITQLEHPEISLLIGDLHSLMRLKSSMRGYILDLFGGFYDMEYVDKRLRIGKVHHRIGVSPKLYVSAMMQLETAVNNCILPLMQEKETEEVFVEFQQALKQLFMFDMQLVFDTYIATLVTEVEMARKEMKDYAEGLEEVIAERTAQLEELSSKDSLTGLYNQRVFYEQMRREIAVAQRIGSRVTLIYFDLNGFKEINDNKGHIAGDNILKFVGQVIQKNIREVDIGCRYGGDEFCIILPNTEQKMAKDIVAKRIFSALEQQDKLRINVSMGVVQTGPDVFCEPDELVKAADQLMYMAKGKSRQNPGNHVEMTEFHLGKGDAKKAVQDLIAQRKANEENYQTVELVAI
ncbi:MAG: sensor histidine kinase [Methyloligella sp.]|jgi:diguanylate cyclase (GGDEF)-like protein|nr:MAG: sensor histidine kinase [Methyloligella sp.]